MQEIEDAVIVEEAVIVEASESEGEAKPKSKGKAKRKGMIVPDSEQELAACRETIDNQSKHLQALAQEILALKNALRIASEDRDRVADERDIANAEIERLRRELEAANEVIKAKPIVRLTRARPFLVKDEIENVVF